MDERLKRKYNYCITAKRLAKIFCISCYSSLDPQNQPISYISLCRTCPGFVRGFKLNKNYSEEYITRKTAYPSIKYWVIFHFIF